MIHINFTENSILLKVGVYPFVYNFQVIRLTTFLSSEGRGDMPAPCHLDIYLTLSIFSDVETLQATFETRSFLEGVMGIQFGSQRLRVFIRYLSSS